MTIEAKAATTGEWEQAHTPIVVAVDGSERNRSAVAWAAHEAAAHGCRLTLVNAVQDYLVPTPHFSVRSQEEEILDMLADLRHEVRDIVPEESVSTEAVVSIVSKLALASVHSVMVR